MKESNMPPAIIEIALIQDITAIIIDPKNRGLNPPAIMITIPAMSSIPP